MASRHSRNTGNALCGTCPRSVECGVTMQRMPRPSSARISRHLRIISPRCLGVGTYDKTRDRMAALAAPAGSDSNRRAPIPPGSTGAVTIASSGAPIRIPRKSHVSTSSRRGHRSNATTRNDASNRRKNPSTSRRPPGAVGRGPRRAIPRARARRSPIAVSRRTIRGAPPPPLPASARRARASAPFARISSPPPPRPPRKETRESPRDTKAKPRSPTFDSQPPPQPPRTRSAPPRDARPRHPSPRAKDAPRTPRARARRRSV